MDLFLFIGQVSGTSSIVNASPVNLKVERSSPVRPSPILVRQLCDFNSSFDLSMFSSKFWHSTFRACWINQVYCLLAETVFAPRSQIIQNFFFWLKFNMFCMFWIVLMCWCQKWFLKNEKTSLACISAWKVIWKATATTLPNTKFNMRYTEAVLAVVLVN